ncbi:U3 snoRNP protein [Perkinsus chesapeaki]|uniref:U3 snoRNP protein n=1 Tax=Perkinsus chesapeaki TaxID=330153 RepID=A0A7J6LFZ7_PERCH|nr:U3 snoRNP protein [Perkinsus chesapeaki]
MTIEAAVEVSSASPSPPPVVGPGEPSIPMTVEPASGLGNFKGVMLCNRPSDVEAERRAALDSKGPPPFKSSVAITHNDPLGLTPPHAVAGPAVSRPKRTAAPTAALRKHTEWLRAFAEEVAAKKAVREQLAKKENEKLKRISEFAAKQREDVRRVIWGSVICRNAPKSGWRPKYFNSPSKPAALGSVGKVGNGQVVEASVTDEKENTDAATERECRMEEAIRGKKRKCGKRQGSKTRPMWSLTEEQALEAAQVDEEELLAFAESVDFDQYINDLEFRTALAVMKDRAGRLSREEEKFRKALQEAYEKELASEGAEEGNSEEEECDDGIGSISGIGFEDSASQQKGPDDASSSVSSMSVTSSVAMRARATAEDGRPMWDAKPLPVDDETQSIVSQALKENHKIRSIHNERSVRGVLETLASKGGSRGGGGVDGQLEERSAASLRALQELMAKPATRPLVVVSRDAAIEKELDPSNMPYLYRCPSI